MFLMFFFFSRLKMVHFTNNTNLNCYKDILEIRRGTSDFMWCSRELKLTKSYRQYHETSNPYKCQYNVFKSPNIQRLIKDVSFNLLIIELTICSDSTV